MDLLTRRWPLIALIASGLILAAAHYWEAQGYAPCTLCLRQREVYWTAIAVAAAALILPLAMRASRTACAFNALLTLCFLFGAGMAGYHVGVEFHWWAGPTECASTGAGASAAGLDALLRGAEIKPPACDEPNWFFLGLSMAFWNLLLSLGLAAASALAAVRSRHP